jgi:hypothetical protein
MTSARWLADGRQCVALCFVATWHAAISDVDPVDAETAFEVSCNSDHRGEMRVFVVWNLSGEDEML